MNSLHMTTDIHRLYIDESGVLSSTDYRRALDRSYGAGNWELFRIEISMEGGIATYHAAIYVNGLLQTPSAMAIGTHPIHGLSFATALDMAKQDCLRQCCETLRIDPVVSRAEIASALREYNDESATAEQEMLEILEPVGRGFGHGVVNGLAIVITTSILAYILVTVLNAIAEAL